MSRMLSECLELSFPADLELVAPAVKRVSTHLRLNGMEQETWSPLELGLVEGLNNAIVHGCSEEAPRIELRVLWAGDELSIEIRDPGHFEPGEDWGSLPEDPLAEGGRGGFLIKQAFSRVGHRNDSDGHVLRMEATVGSKTVDPEQACEAQSALIRAATDLEGAFETVSGLRFLVSLLAKATTPAELMEPALERLHEIDPYAFACVRMVRGTFLKLESGFGDVPTVIPSLSLGEDTVETRAVLTLSTLQVETCAALAEDDPLRGLGGPAVVVPIRYETERIGSLAVVRPEGETFFGAGTVALTHTLAEFLGVAWATAQLQARERELAYTERELTVAAEMQARLLPEAFPKRHDVRFSGACRSAQTVGGDFYDVFAVDGGTVVVIADAMGKGVPAAFVASVLRCAIRARTQQASDPGALLADVNRQIIGDLLAVDLFITALVAFIPDGAGEIRLVSAGHCPMMIRRRSGEVDVIEGSGMPLGVLAEAEYASSAASWDIGDMAVFYTDGIYEVGPADEAHLGLQWMRRVIADSAGQDADDTVSGLLSATRERSGGGPASDDRTLLICERAA